MPLRSRVQDVPPVREAVDGRDRGEDLPQEERGKKQGVPQRGLAQGHGGQRGFPGVLLFRRIFLTGRGGGGVALAAGTVDAVMTPSSCGGDPFVIHVTL